ncbi:periplasmic heavy metal sensor [Candidatus Albibeggiatoa sp. nov. BB20]|uniref:periplasmic heavy metal sensor n=1 Tax=Candidatus Albibeggiatoa sp. nov. BB20 TaxID=3162723 RepID=UPI0033657102
MKQQKWFILTLVISLILNIFIAGILLGGYLFPPPIGSHPPEMIMRPPHPKHLFWMLKQLPEETRQKVEPIVQQQFQHGKVRTEMRQTRKLFHDIEALFVAESFDKLAIQQQFKLLQDRKNQMAKRLNESLLSIADQLNQTERQQLIQAIRHSRPRGKPPHHQRRGEHRDFDKFEKID